MNKTIFLFFTAITLWSTPAITIDLHGLPLDEKNKATIELREAQEKLDQSHYVLKATGYVVAGEIVARAINAAPKALDDEIITLATKPLSRIVRIPLLALAICALKTGYDLRRNVESAQEKLQGL